MTEVLMKSVFGSHLYGTNVATSDRDYKQIHKCNMRDILLGRDKLNITSQTSSGGKSVKNTKDDVDFESKELRQFIKDCLGGQTYALDLLFTPDHLVLQKSKAWDYLKENRSKLVTNNLKAFMGYCKSQSFKYSKKGNTLSEVENIYNKLAAANQKLKVVDVVGDNYVGGESVFTEPRINTATGQDETYLVVGSSSYPTNRQVAEVMTSIKQKYDTYGERAKMAQQLNGVDLKAFYHAFRICWELEEILTTGEITFPSNKVGFLLEVRRGIYSKDYIEQWLTDEIARVDLIENKLLDPDFTFWEDWIVFQYLGC